MKLFISGTLSILAFIGIGVIGCLWLGQRITFGQFALAEAICLAVVWIAPKIDN